MMAQTRIKRASQDRTHLDNVCETDAQISKTIVNSLGEKERRIYNHISSGAAWAECHLHDIGLSDGKWKHCGKDTQDITHVSWQCPVINKHRKLNDLDQIDPDLLPTYIKHGVPKAMASNVEATYWGDTEEDILYNKTQNNNNNSPLAMKRRNT